VSDAPTPVDRVNLRVVSPEEVLVEAQVLWVQVPLVDGYMGIWPGHTDLIGALGPGPVRYALSDAEEREVEVSRGIVRVTPERCAVLISRLLGDEGPDEPLLADEDRDSLFDDLAGALDDAFTEDQIEGLQGEPRGDRT
jgi:F0F1-type ATP synthase epsilon subunit